MYQDAKSRCATDRVLSLALDKLLAETKAALRRWKIRAGVPPLPHLLRFASKSGKQDENFPLYVLHFRAV